ncbi:MAG: prolyl oligopeptidase family serine peptidase [Candidatus Cloacimonetes bacterium]|nr:prolyl oligopeptidase family serine peptidase [Candidatus Cloacimonadota bacterium]
MCTNLNAQKGYKIPEEDILDIYNIPPFPFIRSIPFDSIALEFTYERNMRLSQLVKPTVKLAGKEIIKNLNGSLNSYPETSLKIRNLKTEKIVQVDLPDKIKIRKYELSFDNQKIAISYDTEKGIKLLVVEISTSKVIKFNSFLINDAFGKGGFQWLIDNKTILVNSVPQNRGNEPLKPLIPDSPIIEETEAKFSQLRTYQNLLTDKHDEDLFRYYFTSQPLFLDTKTSKTKKFGNPAIYSDISSSPDSKYYLVTKINEPFSNQVPYYYFPKSFEILDKTGTKIKTFYERPLQDQIPIGGTYQGARYIQWQPLKKATLVWVEALDKGDPKENVPYRDKIVRSIFPFSEIEEIIKIENRFSGIDWSEEEGEMIFHEYDRDKLWSKSWIYWINSKERNIINDISINDEYNDSGNIVKKKSKSGNNLYVKQDDCIFFINNNGSTPEGNFPYLAKYNYKTNEKDILFRSEKDNYERVRGFTNKNYSEILFASEDKKTPTNYFLLNLDNQKREQITNFNNPYPEITNFRKELINYKRDDGISLSGTLYLPHDYQKGTRLPLILHAYPDEYTDSSTAGQITSTPNRFIYFSGTTIKYFVLKGFAVLTNASIPIVGDPETVNETFIDQTISSVKAAIDYLDEKEIIDSKRVGITGHSYGAFMVANVLAHSDLCTAGIAKSGAYNRTLTPFGFQSERRTLWKAKDFYFKASPFMHAEKINEPLLLIHGKDDPNSGTYPMQSKRFYQALKGNGATAKLVLLPYEKHGYYARESQLHVLTEMIEWFEKYVKNKK